VAILFSFFTAVGYRLELFAQVCMRLHHLVKRRALLMDQLYVGGFKVLHVVLVVGASIGMVVSLQTGIELGRIGQQNQIGNVVAASMTREMGPFMTAVILAAATGSALAAELGTMSVTEELAALEVQSVDRVSFLVMPRVVALAILAPILTILCDAVGIVGGGLVARSLLGVDSSLYYQTVMDSLQTQMEILPLPKDIYLGLVKSVVFGIVIAVISCAAGIRTQGGPLAVGGSTRAAVVASIILVIILNYLMTFFFYQQ
jgi:phospholipid/cholesterol/gamma-HCH transport system permease protein